MNQDNEYEIILTFDKKGDYIYVIRKHVKKHFIDHYVNTYTYQEAVSKCEELNKKHKQ